MSDVDKLVEAYFREKEQNDPITTLMEYIKEVHQELLIEEKEAPIKSSKAKDFVLSLPKMVPTEAWGDPSNATRQEMVKISAELRPELCRYPQA